MSEPLERVRLIRRLVGKLWAALAALLRAVCKGWPRCNSVEQTALAQFVLEVEQARRVSGEKGERG